jgi:malate dehydrogenase (oxaloacetate-decarboxylating)
MLIAAAHAIASAVGEKLASDYIIPGAFDEGIAYKVAEAVAQAARESGVARI